MNKHTQSSMIENTIIAYLDKGLTDKSEIFSKVVNDLGVPRPTVRRVSRDLLTKFQAYAKVLDPLPGGPERPHNY